MKKLIICLSLVFCSFVLFAQQNDFKYQGELPTNKFVLLSDDEAPSEAKANAIDNRNRIYLMINDDDNTLTINNHNVFYKDLEIHFKYIFTNPDKYEHLPENPRKAVIFTNLYDNNLPVNDEVEMFKRSMVFLKIVNTYTQLQEQEMHNLLSTSWEEISERATKYIMELRPNYAITETEYEETEEEEVVEVVESPAPEYYPADEREQALQPRNACRIKVNDKGEIRVRDELMTLQEVKSFLKEFILNPNKREDFAEKPTYVNIRIEYGNGEDYNRYVNVYEQIRIVYSEVWNEIALETYNTDYENLNYKIQKEIRNSYPFVVIEESRFDD